MLFKDLFLKSCFYGDGHKNFINEDKRQALESKLVKRFSIVPGYTVAHPIKTNSRTVMKLQQNDHPVTPERQGSVVVSLPVAYVDLHPSLLENLYSGCQSE